MLNTLAAIEQAIKNLDAKITRHINTEPRMIVATVAAFAGSWANSGGAYSVATYWKDPWGTVHLRGRVTGGTGLIFTLPANFRPIGTLSFEVPTGNVVDVEADGDVRLISGAAPVSLDSITFRAEQ